MIIYDRKMLSDIVEPITVFSNGTLGTKDCLAGMRPELILDSFLNFGNAAHIDQPQGLHLHMCLETMRSGLIAYKSFGMFNAPPKTWRRRSGSWIHDPELEVNGAITCARGINLATYDYASSVCGPKNVWACFIPFDAQIVVPWVTRNRECLRVDRCKLLGVVK